MLIRGLLYDGRVTGAEKSGERKAERGCAPSFTTHFIKVLLSLFVLYDGAGPILTAAPGLTPT